MMTGWLVFVLVCVLCFPVVSADGELACLELTSSGSGTPSCPISGQTFSELSAVVAGDYTGSGCSASMTANATNAYSAAWATLQGQKSQSISCSTSVFSGTATKCYFGVICRVPGINIVEGPPTLWHRASSVAIKLALNARPSANAQVSCSCTPPSSFGLDPSLVGSMCSSSVATFTKSDGLGRYNVAQTVYVSVMPHQYQWSGPLTITCGLVKGSEANLQPSTAPLVLSPPMTTCIYDETSAACDSPPPPSATYCADCSPMQFPGNIEFEGPMHAAQAVYLGGQSTGDGPVIRMNTSRSNSIEITSSLAVTGLVAVLDSSSVQDTLSAASVKIPSPSSVNGPQLLSSMSLSNSWTVPTLSFDPPIYLGLHSMRFFRANPATVSVEPLFAEAHAESSSPMSPYIAAGCTGHITQVVITISASAAKTSNLNTATQLDFFVFVNNAIVSSPPSYLRDTGSTDFLDFVAINGYNYRHVYTYASPVAVNRGDNLSVIYNANWSTQPEFTSVALQLQCAFGNI